MKRLPFEILYEDREIIVIAKPAGLLTTHTHLAGRAARAAQPTAENFLNDYVRKGQAKSTKRVWLVHRLDRETSGVMMFAKSEDVAERFRSDWGALTEKTYLARVVGKMEADAGVYESYLAEDADGYRVRSVKNGGQGLTALPKFARTEWKVISEEGGTTLVEVALKTGRKNQIRVHFAEHAHPVVGDEKYGGPKAKRLYLHALRLRVKRGEKWETFEVEP